MHFCGLFHDLFFSCRGNGVEGEESTTCYSDVALNEKKIAASSVGSKRVNQVSPCLCFRRRHRVYPGFQSRIRSWRKSRKLVLNNFYPNGDLDSERDLPTSNLMDRNNEDYDLASIDYSENMKVLERLYPDTTQAERHRFLVGRTLGRSIEKLGNFMKYRKNTKLDDDEFVLQQSVLRNDEDCWNFVVNFTAKRMGVDLECKVPQIIRLESDSKKDGIRTLDGKRVVHLLAAMMDLDIAPQEFYSACIISYLHFKLDRESLESITVLVDVRAGEGWRNPPALTILPFIKITSKTLGHTMPERLDTCIVYPMPIPAKVIWVVVSSFLNQKHLNKVKIVWEASSNADSENKLENMKEFFDDETISRIEARRVAQFLPVLNQQ